MFADPPKLPGLPSGQAQHLRAPHRRRGHGL